MFPVHQAMDARPKEEWIPFIFFSVVSASAKYLYYVVRLSVAIMLSHDLFSFSCLIIVDKVLTHSYPCFTYRPTINPVRSTRRMGAGPRLGYAAHRAFSYDELVGHCVNDL